MVDAERRLLANALLDLSNHRFLLLSETCIPLYPFPVVHRYLTSSPHSFVGSFDDPRPVGRGRYSPRMSPAVSLHDWRKGSQWFELRRDLAVEIVADRTFFPLFRDHCRPSCYVDEHYLPTVVTKLFPARNSNRSVTWVDWSKGGSHPVTFERRHVSEKFLNEIRNGSKCSYNGSETTMCFLFARKFAPSALAPLLELAPVLLS